MPTIESNWRPMCFTFWHQRQTNSSHKLSNNWARLDVRIQSFLLVNITLMKLIFYIHWYFLFFILKLPRFTQKNQDKKDSFAYALINIFIKIFLINLYIYNYLQLKSLYNFLVFKNWNIIRGVRQSACVAKFDIWKNQKKIEKGGTFLTVTFFEITECDIF